MIALIPIATIKKKEYEDYINKEKLPLLRLDSTYLLNIKAYNYIIQQIRKSGIDISRIEELGKLKKGQERKGGEKAYGIMVKSITKLTIHPLRLELKSVSKSSFVKPCDIAIISTGIGSIGRSGIIPRFLINDLVKEFFDENLPVAVTQHIIKFELEQKDILPYYIITLLNSFYGRLLIEGIATYGATGQLEVHTSILSKLKVPIVDIHDKIAETVEKALEDYEARAWRAYFRAMNIINEYIGYKDFTITGTGTLKNIKALNRCDSSGILAQLILMKVAERTQAPIISLGQLFTIRPGNVPWTSEYIGRDRKGIPYIGIDAIDDSGIVDDEKLDYMPEHLFKPSFRQADRGEILLVKDGSKVGKAGMTYEPIYVRQGIYILKPRQHTDVSYYVMALLKSELYQNIFRLLSYGMAHPHLSKEVVERLPILMLKDKDEIASYMKEFVENIYQANALKRQAIAELENYILKLVG